MQMENMIYAQHFGMGENKLKVANCKKRYANECKHKAFIDNIEWKRTCMHTEHAIKYSFGKCKLK